MTGILKYNDTLNIDYMSINSWTCVADGVDTDIGIVIRIGRGNILLTYTPDTNTVPDDTYIQNVYFSGNIFITTQHNTLWIKPPYPDWPVTVSGEIIYNIGYQPPSPIPDITYGLPWRLG
jgi:hypothetical protein